MRKWVIIFLLLINAIVFFGFVMRSNDAPIPPDMEVEQAFELRLVSEVAQDSLIKIAEKRKQADTRAWFVEGACVSYEGIQDQKSADDIAGFMAEQGLNPIILMQEAAAKTYHLVLAVPKQSEDRLALTSQLQEKGMLLTQKIINAEAVFQIGRFASAELAEKARLELLPAFKEIQVQKVLASNGAYSIQLIDDVDRNLINKINDLLKLTYETLKIEKKVCKGVASTKPHQ